MNRARTATAALAIAAASLLAPTIASADPWLDATSNGSPASSDGALGQPISIRGFGCSNTTGTAVMGEFVSMIDDPWVMGDPSSLGPDEVYHLSFPVDAAGSFGWDLVIPLDNGVGLFRVRWYCATQPVESLTDPAVTWVSPELQMTIEPPAAPAARRSILGGKAAGGPGGGELAQRAVSIDVDPDALPAVDRIAIPGATASALKTRVDARVAKLERDRRTVAKALWMFPAVAKQLRAPATTADYVTAAHQELTGRVPNAKAQKAGVARLDDGHLKVQVVEDIALTVHDAAWWIRRA